MFQGFGKELIPFFLDLRFHNDKSFMDANRERYYREVRQPFYDFIGNGLFLIPPDTFPSFHHFCQIHSRYLR